MRKPKFTAVPHEVIDTHLADLSGPELKVLLVILRLTYGWNRDTRQVSLSQMVSLSGLSRSACCDSIRSLEAKKLIRATRNSSESGAHSPSTYEPLFEEDTLVAVADHPLSAETTTPLSAGTTSIRNIEKEQIEKEFPSVGSLSGNTPLTDKSIKWVAQRFRDHGHKLTAQESRETVEWLGTLECSEEDLEAALAGYFADPYWQEKGYPPSAFRKQFEKYRQTPTPRTAPETPQPAAPETMAVALTWRQDIRYGEYLATLAKYGRRITETEAERAYPTWCTLTDEQKAKTIADAEYVASNASNPKYIPGPVKHLSDKPWTAIRADVVPRTERQITDDARFQRQLAMLNKMNPSGVRKQ
jgi:phage replication O-like protein O